MHFKILDACKTSKVFSGMNKPVRSMTHFKILERLQDLKGFYGTSKPVRSSEDDEI